MTSAEPSLGTAVRRSKEASLARLFVDLHGSSAALRCFVLQLASGKRILDELRDDSLAQMGHELVLLLDRRNRINDALFQVLLSDHPGARSAIVEVAEKWGVPGGRLRPTWSDRARASVSRRWGGGAILAATIGCAALLSMTIQRLDERGTDSRRAEGAVAPVASPASPSLDGPDALPASPISPPPRDRPEPEARGGRPQSGTNVTRDRRCSADVQERYTPAIPNEGGLRTTVRLTIHVGRDGVAETVAWPSADDRLDGARTAVNAALVRQRRAWTNTEVPCEYTVDWRP